MTDDQKEINRRVALAFGWRWVRLTFVSSFESRVTIRFMPPTFKASVTTGVDYLNVAGEPESHDEDFRLLPPYCADPAAADLVRLEIERRGWMLTRIDYRSERPMPACPSQHRAQIHTGHIKHDEGIWGVSDDSPHMALCLAFLAACEANAEAGRAGETMIADVDAAQFSRQKQVHYQVNRANAALLSAAPDMVEALECAEDAETIRHVTVLGDEFHAICDKWRARAEEILADRYPMEERFPGWVGSAMRELSQETRRLALIKAKGQTT